MRQARDFLLAAWRAVFDDPVTAGPTNWAVVLLSCVAAAIACMVVAVLLSSSSSRRR